MRGYGSGHTGLIIATVPAMLLLVSPFAGRVSDRFAFRHQTTLGLALVTAGLATLATLQMDTPTSQVVPRLALIGIGAAIFQSPNSASILSAVPRRMLGTASAAVATSRNIGNAAGLALASTILVAVAESSAGVGATRVDRLPATALLDGIQLAFIVAACFSSTAIVASLFRSRRDATAETIGPSAGSESSAAGDAPRSP